MRASGLVILLACGLAAWWAQQASANEGGKVVTGHRVVRGQRDFNLYVINEPLPTLMLIYNRNEEECNPGQTSCGELYESFKQAAQETKGYVRFASLDVSNDEVQDIVKTTMRMDDKPPMMFAFAEAGNGNGGRPAMRLNTAYGTSTAALKKIAADLLPSKVHRSTSIDEFINATQEAKAKNRPLVALFAPKLSDKPTPMIKAAWVLVQNIANLTTVDYTSAGGQDIAKSLPEFASEYIGRNETFLVGLDPEGKFIKSNETSVTPDSIQSFASALVLLHRKAKGGSTSSKSEKKKSVPRGVYTNMTEEDLERLIMYPATATLLAIRRGDSEDVHPPEDPSTNETFMVTASTLFAAYGVHSAIVYCDHPTAPPQVCLKAFGSKSDSDWAYYVIPHLKPGNKNGDQREYIPVKTLSEGAAKAGKSMIEAEQESDDALEVIEATAASDFLQLSMAQFSAESMRPNARMPLIYLGAENEEPPSFLRAAHATMRGLAKIVYVKPGDYDKHAIFQSLYLDPAVTFLPYLVAYMPDIEGMKKQQEEAEKEAAKNKKKKNKAPPKAPQLSFRVVPYETQKQAFGGAMQYETVVLFIQDLFRHVDEERWDKFMTEVFPIAAPPALSNPVLSRMGKSRPTDSAKIPPTEFVHNSAEFDRVCSAASLCIVAFSDTRDDAKRFEVVETARKALEKTGNGAGVRFALIDGSCHFEVVEKLGGDPSMLPLVTAFGKRGYAVMRGAFTADNIQALVQSLRKGTQGYVPLQGTSPSQAFGKEDDCYAKQAQDLGDDEDDMIRELREEAEREQKAKEVARKQAEEEAKRLKEERDATLKRQKEELHRKAEEERAARKKRQMELDEERLKQKQAKKTEL